MDCWELTKVNEAISLEVPETLDPEWAAKAITRLSESGRAIIIHGGKPVFCAGLPLARAAANKLDPLASIKKLGELLNRIDSDPRPIISVIEGEAKGGGVGLAVIADVAIAHLDASFQLPEVYMGIIPADVFPFVERRTGTSNARRLALGWRPLDAREALRCGLVDIVTADPRSELIAQLGRWQRCEPRAIAEVRRLASRGWEQKDAIDSFIRLWASGGLERIRRFERGEAPWEDIP